MIDQKMIDALVGELSTENIKLPDLVPPFEKTFGETMVNKVIKDFKEKQIITDDSSADVIVENGKVIVKMNLIFNDTNIAHNLFNTKGASLNLSQRWSYTMINQNTIFITFEVK